MGKIPVINIRVELIVVIGIKPVINISSSISSSN